MGQAMQEEEFINTNYDAIPSELKSLKQWFCYKLSQENGKTVKKNLSPKTGLEIDFKETFTFEECSYKVGMGNFDGLGFWLNDTQIYSVISLNGGSADLTFIKKFEEIVATIGSYTESSQSGMDFKIWIKGKVETNIVGNKKEIEVLTKNAFVYVTGNYIGNTKIIESQAYLSQIYKESQGDAKIIKFIDIEPVKTLDDEEIIKRIRNSSDKESFIAFKNGYLNDCLNKKDAETELIKIIAKHTKNKAQIAVIFSETKMYDDAKDYEYYETIIKNVLSKTPQIKDYNIQDVVDSIKMPTPKTLGSKDIVIPKEQVDRLEIAKKSTEKRIAEIEEKITYREDIPDNTEIESKDYEIPYPPGFAGYIARDYFYAQSARSVKEVSILGTLALLSSIFGKAYNISGTGLNQYYLLVATTGIGKEEVARGFDRLFAEISKKGLKQAMSFRGAGEIASGQSLTRDISKHPCQVAILGEFYSVIRRISADKVQPHDENLKKVLLELYVKSGKNAVMQRMIYADEKKNVEPTKAPAFSIFGECNPRDLYESINEKLIASGLLPRFIMLHYKGKREYMNPNFLTYEIPKDFLDRIRAIAENSLKMIASGEVIDVICDEDVKIFFKEIDIKTTDYINNTNSSPAKELWNRVHLKVMKISALLACADNHLDPIININHAKWAYDLILRHTQDLIDKFDSGDIGQTNESSQQIKDVISAIKFYLNSDNNILAKYKVNFDMQMNGIIGYSFIYNKICHYSSFKNSRFPIPKLCKDALRNLEDRGYIEICYSNEIKNLGGRKGLYYKIINKNVFGVRG
jgi:hypothetical protein